MKSEFCENYISRLQTILQHQSWEGVRQLAENLQNAWKEGKQVFLCGNGGSAGNAMHIANDFIYGISKSNGMGLRASALPANSSVLTCLANDISYEDIFSQQIAVLGNPGDILIVLSGSGNSPNIIKAILKAKELQMKTFAILGYSGGKCLELADTSIHFAIEDMQISEDIQLIVGHMCTQWLSDNPK